MEMHKYVEVEPIDTEDWLHLIKKRDKYRYITSEMQSMSKYLGKICYI